MKTLVVTVLDLNALGLERYVEYEDVGGDGLGL